MLLGDQLGGSGSPWARDKDGLDQDGSRGEEKQSLVGVGVGRVLGLGVGPAGVQGDSRLLV